MEELVAENDAELLSVSLEKQVPHGNIIKLFHAACEGGYLQVVEELRSEEPRNDAQSFEYRGQTALQAASERGYLQGVELLLAAGARVNTGPNWDGQTALKSASKGGHLQVVKRLLAAGAIVNAWSLEEMAKQLLRRLLRKVILISLGYPSL